MKVRTAAVSDADRLAELATQLGYPSTADDIRRRLPLVEGGGHCLRVADLDGRVAGWIHAVHVALLDSDAHVEIKALVVDEEARGRRIGEELVREVESWARARGCSTLRVRSNVLRERAHRFYERLGYEIQKTQRVFGKRLGS
jgi:GNAT superfamily N-acetyltransferase